MTNIVDAGLSKRRSFVHATGNRIIRWAVGSIIFTAAAAFASARFLH